MEHNFIILKPERRKKKLIKLLVKRQKRDIWNKINKKSKMYRTSIEKSVS